MTSYFLEMDIDRPYIFWRNLALVSTFLVLTPVVLLASLISLISIQSVPAKSLTKTATASTVGTSIYASLPATIPAVTSFVTAADARTEIVRQYLSEYDSPLTPYANEIVQLADKYGLDYRYIPAIARQESNLCHVIPPGSFNCWGWGITSVSSLGFDSYADAIETVTKGLKENYINEGLTTPLQIMSKYTPNSNGSWAKGVSEFMSEME